jgi:HemK-like putative methylase
MPRLRPQLLRHAQTLSLDLAALLPACRDLESAGNELRWLKDHAQRAAKANWQNHLSELCRKRGRGVPLQYVLGSQPFGPLDILCKPGVLIPRADTEAYVYRLVEMIKSGSLLDPRSSSRGLNVVDFCTGTGCIPLFLYSALQASVKPLSVRGVDISPTALRLSKKNLAHNLKGKSIQELRMDQSISFDMIDVFNDADIQSLAGESLDLMVSNPPYVSKDSWNYGRGDMGYSVRKYEPRLALVPGDHLPDAPKALRAEDVFYSRLLDVALVLRTKAVLFEIGDEGQARRVVEYCQRHPYSKGSHFEVWRDDPSSSLTGEQGVWQLIDEDGKPVTVPVVGHGNIRSILIKKHL